jgi:hypothetical protein
VKSVIDRGVVTDWVLTLLRGAGMFIGDVIAPSEAGWTGDMGKPGSVFIPFVVLTPGTASAPTGSFADSSEDWQLPYSLMSFGVDRRQVEDLADDARRLLGNQRRVDLVMRDGVSSWRVVQVTWPSIGAVGYTAQVDPTAFSQTDTSVLWLSKNL